MLTHHSYTERRAKLTRDIADAQHQVDAALADTEGRTDARVHAQKHALASLVSARDDLDAAWRASQAKIAEAAKADDVSRRQVAVTAVDETLANMIQMTAELETLKNRHDALRAKCYQSGQTIRRVVASCLNLRDVRERDRIDALPTFAIDGDVEWWASRTKEMVQRILYPESGRSLAIVPDEVSA